MTDPGAPRRGRHASPDEGSTGWVQGAGSPSWEETPSWSAGQPAAWDTDSWADPAGSWRTGPSSAERYSGTSPGFTDTTEWAVGGSRRVSGLLEHRPDETGPVPQSRHRPGTGDTGGQGPAPRDDVPGLGERGSGPSGASGGGARHPSGPLPPMPRSTWSKLQPRLKQLQPGTFRLCFAIAGRNEVGQRDCVCVSLVGGDVWAVKAQNDRSRSVPCWHLRGLRAQRPIGKFTLRSWLVIKGQPMAAITS